MSEPAYIVCGLGYGDEGKGSVVDFIARHTGAKWVVRFNGGSNAAHNVITPDGRHHTFSQFGSATFLPGVKTHLSGYFILNPGAMIAEEQHLRTVGVTDAFDRISVHGDALVTTHYQIEANRERERLRGQSRHGSCGVGLGETVADAIDGHALRFWDLGNPDVTRRKISRIRARNIAEFGKYPGSDFHDEPVDYWVEFYRHFSTLVRPGNTAEIFDGPGTLIFEGAQGVLLDQVHGFNPYTTWSTTTFENALKIIGYERTCRKIGVTRTYMTRHGAGPFGPEYTDRELDEPHNTSGPWQGRFRAGPMDPFAIRYAINVCGGVDELALTHTDRVDPAWSLKSLGVPVSIRSFGPTATEKTWVRL